MKTLKQKVQVVIEEKQLCSIMNNTKWGKLQHEVLHTLPFTPPFQAKYVLEDTPEPEVFDSDVWYWGDWIEGLLPFYSVEWIRVRPRYLKHQGMLVEPEVIDITEDFRSLLDNLNVPYKEESNSFYIYGYISNTDSLITE
ncbi:DUF6678 family protein [Aneurinibacillus sp. REN35]|uniref:DUF6678 family protein n=1 Tax=Aneurinibacillus sp. REN35 TaxID=3237286 RepID=UPI00352730FC